MSVNLVVVHGECSRPSDVRELESGTRLASLALRVPSDEGAATSVPVTVWSPPTWVEDLDVGDEVVVLGAVRRRFYKTGAGTGARVDVEAVAVARAGRKREISAILRKAQTALDELAG